MRTVWVLLMSALVVATVAARPESVRLPAPQAPGAADPFPEGTGKAALLRVCGNCHEAGNVIQMLRTRQEWADVVDQMARFGAEASDQDFEQILNYLVKFFSPIRVNRATAKELENVLDISAEAAEAIVTMRQEKGAFKAIDDLKAVAGLDWAKVEVRKARLVFST